MSLILRPYQQQAVDEVRGILADKKSLILCIPTGGGKTVVFSYIAQQVIEKGKRVMILCDRKELITQAYEKLFSYGLIPTIIAPGYRFQLNSCYLASVDTLRRRHLPDIDILVIDEAHKQTFDGIALQYIEKGTMIIGATATPMRSNQQRPMREIYRQIVNPISIDNLINENFLVAARTFGAIEDFSDVGMKGGDYDNEALYKKFNQLKRYDGVVEKYNQFSAGKKAICFNVNVEHSRQMTQAFSRAGVSAQHLDGSMSTSQRKEILSGFKRGAFRVLCNCSVLTTGYDEPSIETVIVNRATTSTPLWLQMCLDEETEVLTNKGWRKYFQVQEGEAIASYDLMSGEIVYEKALEKVERFTYMDEYFISIDTPFLNFRVTNQHDLLYKPRRTKRIFEKIEAEKLGERKSEYLMPISGFENKKGCDLTNWELSFIGWFLTDGSLDKNTNRITIYQSESQPLWIHDHIKKTLEQCGFKYSILKTKKGEYKEVVSYRVSKGIPREKDKHLTGWGRLEKYIDKNFHSELQNLTRQQLIVLLYAIHLGDGSKAITNNYRISTGNKEFADNLQRACVTNGIKCNISEHFYNKNILFMLNIDIDSQAIYLRGKNGKDGSKISAEKYESSEFVWCLKTRLGTLITRRKGKVLIMGNCGRGSRTYANKEHFTIIDMGSNTARLGFWEDEREWTLEPKKKRKTLQAAPVKECPLCGALVRAAAPVCPHCQNPFEKKPNELKKGTFQELKPNQLRGARKRFDAYTATDAQIEAYGKEMGYKQGWALVQKKLRDERKMKKV